MEDQPVSFRQGVLPNIETLAQRHIRRWVLAGSQELSQRVNSSGATSTSRRIERDEPATQILATVVRHGGGASVGVSEKAMASAPAKLGEPE